MIGDVILTNIISILPESKLIIGDILVSIITVCRNSEKTIAKTIESVLNQTYSQIEYLIIDGASTDGTLEIVKRYEPEFKGRMRWFSEKDAGIYDAMNKGIGLAEGTIIGLINSDDWYERDSIELVVDACRENGDGVYYGILRVLEEGKEVMLKATNYQFLHREVVGHPAYFVSKSVYRKHGPFQLEYKYAADYELMMRFIHARVPFIQIDRIIANFNEGGKSTLHGFENYKEYLRIRHKFGHLTRKAMYLKILRGKITLLLEKIR